MTAPAARSSLLSSLLHIYAPEPASPRLTDPPAVAHAWKHWRWRMLLCMFLGYGILYFGRKNISAALPVLGSDLGYTNTQLGILGSTLYVTYGLGKFLNGILADRSNIRTFMATGVIISGLCNLVFGSMTSLWSLALVWGFNGWFQSMGFPPIARGMTIWYEPQGRATRWALWTTSHQAGTAAIMLLSSLLLSLSHNDWRWCFYLPGVICVVAGVALLWSMADTPESKGLPSVVSFTADTQEADQAYWPLFLQRVLLNRALWVIALVNLCVYIVRYGTLDWATKYLVETKGYPVATAAGMAASIPAFGIAGVLVCGWVSDVVFKGRFRAVNAIMLAALALAMAAFHATGSTQAYVVDFAFLGLIGFLVEGPQSLLGGIAAVDVGGNTKVASAAAGLVGICGYVGATLSSLGTGYCVDRFGWSGGFGFWIGCAVLGLLLCLLAWKSPPRTA